LFRRMQCGKVRDRETGAVVYVSQRRKLPVSLLNKKIRNNYKQ